MMLFNFGAVVLEKGIHLLWFDTLGDVEYVAHGTLICDPWNKLFNNLGRPALAKSSTLATPLSIHFFLLKALNKLKLYG
jgi:hypothetical protein